MPPRFKTESASSKLCSSAGSTQCRLEPTQFANSNGLVAVHFLLPLSSSNLLSPWMTGAVNRRDRNCTISPVSLQNLKILSVSWGERPNNQAYFINFSPVQLPAKRRHVAWIKFWKNECWMWHFSVPWWVLWRDSLLRVSLLPTRYSNWIIVSLSILLICAICIQPTVCGHLMQLPYVNQL